MSPKIHNLSLGQKNFIINTKEFSSVSRYEKQTNLSRFVIIILTLFILKMMGELFGNAIGKESSEGEADMGFKIEKVPRFHYHR